jgi:molecular chaperone DnaK
MAKIRRPARLAAGGVGRVEVALAAARATVAGDDRAALDRAADELQAASHQMAEALYQAQAATPSGGSTPSAGGDVKDAEVVDAEYAETC